MRAIKVFAVAFFICSLALLGVNLFLQSNRADRPWIKAENGEVTVSVKDDRSAWAEGITAGVGKEESLTDRIRLSKIGKMSEDGGLEVTYTVVDEKGQAASLLRTVRFSDYTPPAFVLLQKPLLQVGATLNLNNLIMVSDPLDGNITHLVKVIRTDLDTGRAGEYEMLLSVETSYGVTAEYTLTVTVI